MDILIEILLEIIIGGTVEGATSEAVPKGVRYALLIFVSLLMLAVIVGCVWLFIISQKIIIKILLLGLAILFIVFLSSMWNKLLKFKK